MIRQQELANEAIVAFWRASKQRWPQLTIEQFSEIGDAVIKRLDDEARGAGVDQDGTVAGMMEIFTGMEEEFTKRYA